MSVHLYFHQFYYQGLQDLQDTFLHKCKMTAWNGSYQFFLDARGIFGLCKMTLIYQ